MVNEALLISSEVLVDDHEARIETIAWASSHYPMLRTPELNRSLIAERVGDPFVRDEDIAVALVAEALGVSRHSVEPPLMTRLVEERRYGKRIYEDAFGCAATTWHGQASLAAVQARAPSLPESLCIVVLSPRARLETMMTLVSTGWASRSTSVVCLDDVDAEGELAIALVAEGFRRAEACAPTGSTPALKTSLEAFSLAFESHLGR